MLLVPGGKARERILVYGGEGVGKTYAWFSILKNTANRAYVLDTDGAVPRFLESEEFAGVEGRITAVEPEGWPDYIDSVGKWSAEATPDDWLVLDLFGKAWDDVQTYFTEQVYGAELADFWMSYRKQLQDAGGKGSKNPFDATIDWVPLKRLYKQLTSGIIRWPGHVFAACGRKVINEMYDDADTKTRYGPHGGKPDAEKTAGHLFHTVLAFKGNTAETRRMSSTKDRQRAMLNGERTGDFSLSYLARLANWRPAP